MATKVGGPAPPLRVAADSVPLAADLGFSFADAFAIAVVFVGIAVFAAIGALSHEHERAFSASIFYLGFGLIAAAGIHFMGIRWLDPFADSTLFEHATELAVVVALFATGLKLERELTFRGWRNVARLLLVAMPLTIGAIALFGSLVMGLSLGAAIALGACLAPTDPVLAGDIGVGPPGDEDEREPNFSITGEAGLNDGLAFPFLLLGDRDRRGRRPRRVGAGRRPLRDRRGARDRRAPRLRDRRAHRPPARPRAAARELDGWVAIGAVAVIYGATEVAGAYGFLAAFAGGIGFRRYEHTHERNRGVHDGAEIVEDVAELALILVLGSCVTLDRPRRARRERLGARPAAAPRHPPAAVLLSLVRTRESLRERAFVGWFGVRGIGSLFYASVVIGVGAFSEGETRIIFWTVAVVVIVSIAVHGISASPLTRRWLPD